MLQFPYYDEALLYIQRPELIPWINTANATCHLAPFAACFACCFLCILLWFVMPLPVKAFFTHWPLGNVKVIWNMLLSIFCSLFCYYFLCIHHAVNSECAAFFSYTHWPLGNLKSNFKYITASIYCHVLLYEFVSISHETCRHLKDEIMDLSKLFWYLNHLPLVLHICIGELSQHLFR